MTAAPTAYRPRDWSAQPPYDYEPYRSTALRSPRQPLVALPASLSEVTGAGPGIATLFTEVIDLTRQATGSAALGERIIVAGRVLDDGGQPVAGTLVEVWQANAAGRYRHDSDQHDAPLDPNFAGAGRCITDTEGRYRFLTVKPGAYPWGNHPNAWRPAHIHFSVFGPALATRLVTQMYFPGDPLHALDPIFNSVPEPVARARLVAEYDHSLTEANWALGYRWDIVLRGPQSTVGHGPQ